MCEKLLKVSEGKTTDSALNIDISINGINFLSSGNLSSPGSVPLNAAAGTFYF